jgi:hypothetical protein
MENVGSCRVVTELCWRQVFYVSGYGHISTAVSKCGLSPASSLAEDYTPYTAAGRPGKLGREILNSAFQINTGVPKRFVAFLGPHSAIQYANLVRG